MLAKTVFLFMVLLFIACQTTPDLRRDSPYFTGFVGSSVKLNQSLKISPNKVSVYMQWGKVMEFRSLDRDQPWCKFEINTMQAQFRSVSPDTFKIIRLYRDEEYVEKTQFKVASLDWQRFGHDATAVIYSTELYLQSERQPDVRVLTCSYWENLNDATHLTVNQIQTALGAILTLQLLHE